MRPAIAAISRRRPTSCPARAGIWPISRAMAVVAMSVTADGGDRAAQVAGVAFEQPRRLVRRHPEPDQDGGLDVAAGRLDEAGGLVPPAADDPSDDGGGAAAELGVAGAHVHHQAAIDAA